MPSRISITLMGIPGGVIAVSQVPDAVVAKKSGLSDVILRKGVVSSVMGAYTAMVVAFSLMPFTDWLNAKDMISGAGVPIWILFAGLVVIAVSSKNRILAFLMVPSFALWWGAFVVSMESQHP